MGIDEKEEKIETVDAILNDDIDLEGDDESVETEVFASQDKFHVNAGEALYIDDIYKIAAKECTKMMVLVGPVASGKTTIETSIYQLFQNSPVEDFYFAGSYSLHGFEQRAYHTRLRSKGNEPQTQRTSLEDSQSFLHLRLFNKNSHIIINLIMADISGEAFTNHIGQVDEVKKSFPFIERADYIVGVIDGEKLCDKKTRNSIVAEIIELVRTFSDANLIMDNCVFQVVFSKYDKLCKTEKFEEIIEKAKKQITGRLGGVFTTIEFYKVAAMPSSANEFKVGYGLDVLLQAWANKRVCKSSVEIKEPFDKLTEYDRLYYKFLGDINE